MLYLIRNQKVVDNVTFEDVITSSDEVIEIDGYNYDSVDKDKMNYKSKYNNYRIIALEKTVLKNTSEQAIHEYANEILKMIGQDTIPKEEHDLYLKMFLEQFGLNEIFKNKV